MLGKVVIVIHPFLQDVLSNRSLEARQPDFAGDTPLHFAHSRPFQLCQICCLIRIFPSQTLFNFCLRMSVKAAKNFLEGFGLITSSSGSPEDGKEPNIGKKNSFGCKLMMNIRSTAGKKEFYSDPCPCPKNQAQ